jgi:monoterpene epsilon-lactone hydrolase
MPSKESEALHDQFASLTARMAANPALDLPTLRSMLEELQVQTAEPATVTYTEAVIDGRRGLWAEPAGASDRHVILYLHGGGFVANSIDSHRKLAAHLAKAAGCRTLLADYRLAPEHSFPAQLLDALAAYDFLLAQGFEPRHVAVAGDSAGGCLATSLLLFLRGAGRELPGALVGISPWYDMEVDGPTLVSNAATDVLVSVDATKGNAAMYLGEVAATDPVANPLYANASGLPPVYLTAGGHEMFLDNAERFADLAKNADVDVTLEISEGMQHIYPFMAGHAAEADDTVANIGRWLRSRLDIA